MSKLDKLKAEIGSNVEESTAGHSSPSAILSGKPGGPPTRPARMIGVEKAKDAALIELDRIVPDPDQPRKEFTEAEMAEMVASLQEDGQLQPIRVRFDEASGKYFLMMGERRFRAARIAGLKSIAAVIHDGPLTAGKILEYQIIENTVRASLKPIELANAIRRLIDECDYTQADVAARLKMTQSAVSQSLSLLKLPPEIQAKVEEGKVSARAAQHIAKVETEEAQLEVAAQVEAGHLTEEEAATVARKARSRSTGSGKGRGAKARAVTKLKTEALWTDSGYRVQVVCKRGIQPETLREVLLRKADALSTAS